MTEGLPGSPNGELPNIKITDQKDQLSPTTESEVNKLFEKKGLFTDPPKGEDSTWHPLNIMREMQNEIDMEKFKPHDKAQEGQWESWKESVRKIDTAYKILAYPHLSVKGFGLEIIQEDLEEDRQINGRDQVTLNDSELQILGKIITTHNNLINFNTQQHTYLYSEVPIAPFINPYGKRNMTTEQIRNSLNKQPELPKT